MSQRASATYENKALQYSLLFSQHVLRALSRHKRTRLVLYFLNIVHVRTRASPGEMHFLTSMHYIMKLKLVSINSN